MEGQGNNDGETYVRKAPSMKVTEIAHALNPRAEYEVVGIQPGEKLHEQMIGEVDAPHTYEYEDYFKILPTINLWDRSVDMIGKGKKVSEDFNYVSDTNDVWMSHEELLDWVDRYREEYSTRPRTR